MKKCYNIYITLCLCGKRFERFFHFCVFVVYGKWLMFKINLVMESDCRGKILYRCLFLLYQYRREIILQCVRITYKTIKLIHDMIKHLPGRTDRRVFQ
jgi:hypothetical protein